MQEKRKLLAKALQCQYTIVTASQTPQLGVGSATATATQGTKERLILKSVKLLDNWRETQEAAGQTAQTAQKTRCKTVLPKVASSGAAS